MGEKVVGLLGSIRLALHDHLGEVVLAPAEAELLSVSLCLFGFCITTFLALVLVLLRLPGELLKCRNLKNILNCSGILIS